MSGLNPCAASRKGTKKETPLETTDYTYDQVGRLVTVANSTDTIVYTYDPLGRRIVAEVDGVVTRTLYDFDKPLLFILQNNPLGFLRNLHEE